MTVIQWIALPFALTAVVWFLRGTIYALAFLLSAVGKFVDELRETTP